MSKKQRSDASLTPTYLLGVAMVTPDYPAGGPGSRFDLTCPVFVCVACGMACDKDHPGIVIWTDQYSEQPSQAMAIVHKGLCDRAYEAAYGRHMWRDLDEFLTQIANNYARPLVGSTVGAAQDLTPWKVHDIQDHLGRDVTPTPDWELWPDDQKARFVRRAAQ